MAYEGQLPHLKVYQIGNEVFSHDLFENLSLRVKQETSHISKEMLYCQQRIWELDLEIKSYEGKEQLLRILEQNELRKKYSDLKKQKTELESGRIKPETHNLAKHTSDRYQLPSIDTLL